MELRHLWHVTRHRWRMLLAGAVVGLALGALLTSLQQTYVSGASVLVAPAAEPARSLYLVNPERFVQTQIRLLGSGPVLAEALPAAGVGSVAELRSMLSVSGGTADDVIDIGVEAGSPDQATSAAEAVAEAYLAEADGSARLLEVGGVTAGQAGWRLPLAGLVGGLGAATALALVAAHLRRRVLSAALLREVVPDGGVFPRDLPTSGRSTGPADAAYAQLVGWLLDRGVRSVVLSHEDAAGERDAVAARLVGALVAEGRPVAVVDPTAAVRRAADDLGLRATDPPAGAPSEVLTSGFRDGGDGDRPRLEDHDVVLVLGRSVPDAPAPQLRLVVAASGRTRQDDVVARTEVLAGPAPRHPVLVVVAAPVPRGRPGPRRGALPPRPAPTRS